MAEYQVLQGIRWLLSGNTDWTNPDVQRKMNMARQAMDSWLSIQSHIDIEQDPTYGRDQGIDNWDVQKGWEDRRIGAGGDLDALGYHWQYNQGDKFIQIDHMEEKEPYYDHKNYDIKTRFYMPAIVAYKPDYGIDIYGQSTYVECGYITTGRNTIKGPYVFHPLTHNQIMRMYPAIGLGYPSTEWPGIKRLGSGNIVMGDHDKYAYVELIEHYYNIPPIFDEVLAELVNWEKISPIYEEIIPIGHDQFEWGQWDGDTTIHHMGEGTCKVEGGDPADRYIWTRDATWYGGWTYLDTICYLSDESPDWAFPGQTFGHVPIVSEGSWEGHSGILTGYHVEDVDLTFSLWPYCEGEWPWSPAQHGQTEDQVWGYVNFQMWHPSMGVYITLPPVPEEEPWEQFPGKHWWDLVPPPGGGKYDAGIWYELDIGGTLGAPYIWACRFGTQVATIGDKNGHFYSKNAYSGWWPGMSSVITDAFEGHAFYFMRGSSQRESLWSRQFSATDENWPWGYTTLFEKCPCLWEFNECGSWPYSEEEPDLCPGGSVVDHPETGEWYETYEGVNGYWDTAVQWYHRLQFDGEVFEFSEANNGDMYGDNGSSQYCHPRNYNYPAAVDTELVGLTGGTPTGRMFTGGWLIGGGGDPGGGYYYYSFIKDGQHEYARFPAPEASQYSTLQFQPFPGMNNIYHNGTTRLMMVQQEVYEFVGPVYQERFGPEALIQ